MTTELGNELAAIARGVRAATVAVHDARERGSGSGVVWEARGLVVTNAHVVRGRGAAIEFHDGRRLRAALVARDEDLDLAALRLEGAEDAFAAARVRDSASLMPGEFVVAVGNPHGIPGAVATGLVHRCNARWVISDVKLAPGNSGGPLVDASGRIVGINSMIARGLALSVPSDAVAAFLRAVRMGSRAA
jgi:serine protease Do